MTNTSAAKIPPITRRRHRLDPVAQYQPSHHSPRRSSVLHGPSVERASFGLGPAEGFVAHLPGMTVDREITNLHHDLAELVEKMGSIQARLASLAYRRADQDGPQLLSIAKAATRIGVSPATMYRMAEAGQVDVVIAGSTKKIPTRWIDEYVDGRANTKARNE